MVTEVEERSSSWKVDGERRETRKEETEIPSTHVPLPGLFLRAHKVDLPVVGSLEDGKVLKAFFFFLGGISKTRSKQPRKDKCCLSGAALLCSKRTGNRRRDGPLNSQLSSMDRRETSSIGLSEEKIGGSSPGAVPHRADKELTRRAKLAFYLSPPRSFLACSLDVAVIALFFFLFLFKLTSRYTGEMFLARVVLVILIESRRVRVCECGRGRGIKN
jgi:hypothetical protein